MLTRWQKYTKVLMTSLHTCRLFTVWPSVIQNDFKTPQQTMRFNFWLYQIYEPCKTKKLRSFLEIILKFFFILATSAGKALGFHVVSGSFVHPHSVQDWFTHLWYMRFLKTWTSWFTAQRWFPAFELWLQMTSDIP